MKKQLELKAEVRGTLDLMESVLEAPGMLAAEYPLVFREGFPGRLVVLEDGGEVRSSCAVLPRTLVFPEGQLPVGLIGSVVTARTHRGRGLAGQVLLEAERWLAQSGAVLSILWADDARFYLPRGYRPVGTEWDLLVDRAAAARLTPWPAVRNGISSDGPELHRLYLGHGRRMERTLEEMDALLECPGMDVLVAEHNGRAVAYVCVGRGRDLHGVVHEWAGSPAAVVGLVRHALEGGDSPHLVVLTPGADNPIAERLLAAGAERHQGVLGLGKVLPGPAAVGRLAREVERLAGGAMVPIPDSGGERFLWRGPAGALEVGSNELLDLFLGQRSSAAPGFAAERTGLDTSRLPVVPFAFGLDSI